MAAMLFPLLIWGGVFALVLHGIRVFEKGKGTSADLEALALVLQEIRESHWAISAKLDRLRAEHDFTTALQRPPEA